MLFRHAIASLSTFIPSPGLTVLSSSVPTADFRGHPNADPIVLTFSNAVTLGTGLITLRKQNRAGVFSDSETFDVQATQGTAPGDITVSGSTITIYPTSPEIMMKYAIRIGANCVSGYAGIANDSTLQYISDTGVIVPLSSDRSYATTVTGQTITTNVMTGGITDTLYDNCTFTVKQQIRDTSSQVCFKGCTFGGSVGTPLDEDAFSIYGTSEIIWENCTFANIRGTTSGAAIKFLQSLASDTITINGCTFENIGENGIVSGKLWNDGVGVDCTNLIINDCTFDDTGLESTAGQFHHIYNQGTDAVIQNNTFLGETDGNGISTRARGLIFNNDVSGTCRSGAFKACIRFYNDHLAGPIVAGLQDNPRTGSTTDQIKIAWNIVDGGSSQGFGISIDRPATPDVDKLEGSGNPVPDDVWYINDCLIWGNTVANVVTNDYEYVAEWPTSSYINIEEDGVTIIADGGGGGQIGALSVTNNTGDVKTYNVDTTAHNDTDDIVVVMGIKSKDPLGDITAVTLDGNAAAQIISKDAVTTNGVFIAYARFSGKAFADASSLAMTSAQAWWGSAAALYAVDAGSTIAEVVSQIESTRAGSVLSGSYTAGATIIGAQINSAGALAAWTGLTEDFDIDYDGDDFFTTASDTNVTGGSTTITTTGISAKTAALSIEVT